MSAESVEEVILEHETECEATVSSFKRDLQKVKTGKASTGLVENIIVEYYGAKTALVHLGQITTPEARLIQIQVFDRSAISAIEKAIQTSGLGLNPSSDGTTIRLLVPPLTEETRRDIVKHLHKLAEDKRVSIRNHRRDANDVIKKLEKDGAVAKDEVKRFLDTIQKQTDSAITELDKMLQVKEAECLEV